MVTWVGTIRTRLRNDPVAIATAIVVLAILLGIVVVTGLIGVGTVRILDQGCQPVETEPAVEFTIASTPTADGVRVVLTHSGGDSVKASDLYIQTSTVNTTVAERSRRLEPQSLLSVKDSITLTDFSRGTRVSLVWMNRSHEYGSACPDPTPYRRVLTEFGIADESTYTKDTTR